MIFNNDGRAYSLRKMFYLFTFFFFGIAPLVQYHSRTSSFEARLLKEEEYFYLNILIIIIMILYEVFYYLFSRFSSLSNIKFVDRFELKKLNFKQTITILFLSCLSFILVLYFNGSNFNGLIFRNDDITVATPNVLELSSSSSLIIGQTIRPLAMICLLYYIISPNRKLFITVILFIFALLTVFPTGVPRFYAAAVYIPLLILSFKILERKNVFSLLFSKNLESFE